VVFFLLPFVHCSRREQERQIVRLDVLMPQHRQVIRIPPTYFYTRSGCFFREIYLKAVAQKTSSFWDRKPSRHEWDVAGGDDKEQSPRVRGGPERVMQKIKDLLEYCKQDTWAMVRIWEWINSQINKT
jgi:hypothetical protein